MSLRTSANRYSKALFDVALQEKADLAKIGQDLSAFAEVIASNAELRLATERSGVADASRIAVMDQIADKLGVAPQVKKLVAMLTQGRRLELMKDLTEAFNERLLAHQNIVRAEVTSAAPLSPEKAKALEESLSKVTGKKVQITSSVDPSLLGGLVVRMGSRQIDTSLKTKLNSLKLALKEVG